jgi:hypothetical protein
MNNLLKSVAVRVFFSLGSIETEFEGYYLSSLKAKMKAVTE